MVVRVCVNPMIDSDLPRVYTASHLKSAGIGINSIDEGCVSVWVYIYIYAL